MPAYNFSFFFPLHLSSFFRSNLLYYNHSRSCLSVVLESCCPESPVKKIPSLTFGDGIIASCRQQRRLCGFVRIQVGPTPLQIHQPRYLRIALVSPYNRTGTSPPLQIIRLWNQGHSRMHNMTRWLLFSHPSPGSLTRRLSSLLTTRYKHNRERLELSRALVVTWTRCWQTCTFP